MDSSIMTNAGLFIGQRHKLPVSGTKGSGWYDKNGNWFGWGDLSRENMLSIAQVLPENELFIVLHEEDAFRRFLRDIMPDRTRRNEDAPGFDYVVDKTLFVIAKGQICRVDDVYPHKQMGTEVSSVTYRFVNLMAARAMILAYNTSAMQPVAA